MGLLLGQLQACNFANRRELAGSLGLVPRQLDQSCATTLMNAP
jgi:hypothetical protein